MWGSKKVALLFWIVVGCYTITLGQTQQAADQLCYAFLMNGNLWLQCSGQKAKITKSADVEDFSVSLDGSVVVLIRHRSKMTGQAELKFPAGTTLTVYSHEVLQIVPLSAHAESRLVPLESPTQLQQSCGEILSISWNAGVGKRGSRLTNVRNAVTDQELRIEPYKNFRCSTDRTTVAGWLDPEHSVLWTGVPPQKEVVDPRTDQLLYDVSPNGRYLAYSTDGKICVAEGERLTCISPAVDTDRLSVSDAGGLLFVTTKGACYYRDQWHQSTAPRPGYTLTDVCTAVAYWHPGARSEDILHLTGRQPQWITPVAASALRRWSLRR